jgi:hypothetical protein
MVQKCVIVPVTVAGILILSVLTTISLTHQAFAQEKPTKLTINMSPDIVAESSYHVTGRLTSEGEELGGATITFTWHQPNMGNNPGAKILSPTQTNSDGFYGVAGSIPYPRDNVIAHYAGDSEHMPAQSTAFLKYATLSNLP